MKNIKLKNLYSSICLIGILSTSYGMASEQAYEDAKRYQRARQNNLDLSFLGQSQAIKESKEFYQQSKTLREKEDADLVWAMEESLRSAPVKADDYHVVKLAISFLNEKYYNKLNQFDAPPKYMHDENYPTTIRKLKKLTQLSDHEIDHKYNFEATLAEKKMFLNQEIEDLTTDFIKLKEYAALHENVFAPTREEIVDLVSGSRNLNPIIVKNVYDLIESGAINDGTFKEDQLKAAPVVAEKPVEEDVNPYNDPTSAIVQTEVGKIITETRLQDRQKIADLVHAKNPNISKEVALEAYSEMMD